MQALHAGATALPVFRDLAPEDLRPLADTGLAHDHVRLGRTGWLARVPKQSQMRLNAADNLAYQAACFAAMAPSGHTPRIHGTLPPDPDLPMGALIVEAIDGRPPRLPDDLDAVMRALAAIHRLPVPPLRQEAFRIASAACSPSWSRTSASTTFAPSRANRSATACPIPRAAPVTTATLFSRRMAGPL